MSRIEKITGPEGLDAEQRAVYDRIAGGARGGVRGPHTVLINNPGLAAPVDQLGVYVRYDCSVPERLRELAILVVAARWKADYEWYAHAPLAKKQGLSDDVLSAIGSGHAPTFAEEADSAVHDFARSMAHDGRVEDDIYARAEQHLGSKGLIDLTGLIGYYTLVAYTLNTFEIGVPDSAAIPWR
ncbi:carboxymuconolactone decarboxylase family protein [Hoeflea sp. YIM 152468]|uniref:carboxymuconolactone decarboxylase family protein n=1 Tax=Hoeflea sp. YIM 152468 TaxID=3031759 RepID=UPI0023D9EF5B|nr:carboxymuconolactone decarboxylase family protein [Hoeflea sp. YIM 152468]MDF1610243.1 carboxymuconolactone decarboxylase family protein [Hoeflea sp. YIM 152468]